MSLPRLISAAEAISDPHVRRWLRYAIARLRNGEPCAEVLALEGDAALDQRDYHLRRAASAVDAATDWRAAGELVHLVRYVQAHPELLNKYPDLPDEPQREVCAALLCADAPKSQRRLFDCLTDARNTSASEIAVNSPPNVIDSGYEFITATG